MCSGPKVLVTATRLTEAGSRLAEPAAATMRAWTSARAAAGSRVIATGMTNAVHRVALAHALRNAGGCSSGHGRGARAGGPCLTALGVSGSLPADFWPQRPAYGKRTLQRARAREALAAGVERARHVPHQGQDKKPKRYQLEMFPYPSGRIHMGHVRNYTLGDVDGPLHARQGLQRAASHGLGRLRPAGRERRHRAQGAPAKSGPIENIDTMRGQLKAMGVSIDWSREFATCDPGYYVHQQRLFLDFLKKKLAYRKTAKVNWDPVENTVLANEQVIDGRGWRSDAVVEQRDLTQWFFKITAYRRGAAAGARRARGQAGRISCAPSSATGSANRPARTCGSRWKAASCRRSCRRWRSSRRGTTPSSAPRSWRSRPSIRWLPISRKKNKELASLHRGVPQDRHHRGGAGQGREARLRHRHRRGASVQAGREAARLRRQLHRHGLRHRRHLRLPRPRSARPRFRPQIWASGGARWCCRPAPIRQTFSIADEAYLGEGTMINSRVPGRAHHRGGQGQDRGPAGGARHRRAQGQLPHARLADLAPALLGLPDPRHPLREGWHRAGARRGPAGEAAGGRDLRQAGQSARPSSDLEARDVSQVRPRPRCARPIPWTRSSTAPGTSSASRRRTQQRRPTRRR